MAANTSLSLTALDYDSLKSDFKTFLSSQSIFRDYDLDGANINVLLSLLAYNTYKNAFMHNMMMSEAFMDSAQLRSSVISHAKNVNYLPASRVSPVAVLECTFETTTSGSFLIPKGTSFAGSNSNGTFTFVTDRNHTLISTSNTFVISDLEVYEGSYINETFIVNTADEAQRFTLSNDTIDIDSIQVTVYENNGSVELPYIQYTHLYDVGPTTRAFFLQANDNQYDVVFGDDVFGRKPLNGATVLVTYRVTNGIAAGGIDSFRINDDLGIYNSTTAIATIATVEKATSGAERETTESIQFRAPRGFQTQQRCVTDQDYSLLIKQAFPEIKTLHIFGGEDYAEIYGTVDYGKVYIAPITYAGTPLSENRKGDVTTFLKGKMSVGLRPEIINPEFLYIILAVTVEYDQNITDLTPSEIKQLAVTTISDHNDTNLEEFNTTFRASVLSEQMQQMDESVLSNTITVRLRKEISPELYKREAQLIAFNNPIAVGSLSSSRFILTDGNTYRLTDYNPSNDTLRKSAGTNGLVITNSSNVVYLRKVNTTNASTPSYTRCGTIDYTKGIVTLTPLAFADFVDYQGVRIDAVPTKQNITVKHNDLIQISVGDCTVKVTGK